MGLSSYSTKPLDQVKLQGQDSVIFFQLYVFKNKQTTEDLIPRVEKAGYKALALTIDTPFIGQRYADYRNDFRLASHLRIGNFENSSNGLIDIGVQADSGGRTAHRTTDEAERAQDADSKANVIDPAMSWDKTIPWLRSVRNMETWVKEVATAEEAELAIRAGVDGIWVSNHGGRQLGSTLPTIESLPEVIEAVKGRMPVHVDGGIRRGGDIFKA